MEREEFRKKLVDLCQVMAEKANKKETALEANVEMMLVAEDLVYVAGAVFGSVKGDMYEDKVSDARAMVLTGFMEGEVESENVVQVREKK